MNEATFNHHIGKSIDWYYKIPDDGSSLGVGGKRPFDGFGVLNGQPVYWEAKFLKAYESFSFKKLKQHQIDNLLDIKEMLPNSYCLFIIGIQVSPRVIRAFIFKDLKQIAERKKLEQNILAKEFKELSNYIEMKESKIDFCKMKLEDLI